jgi:hypothetical protein
VLGIVCIALVLICGTVQVAHNHPTGQPNHDCSLCTTAHHVIQVVALAALDVSGQPVAPVAPEPTRELPRRPFFFKLSCRPPPAAPAFA